MRYKFTIMKMTLKVLGFILISIFFIGNTFGQNATFNYTRTTGALGTTYSWIDCTTGGTEIIDADWTTTGAFSAADDGYLNINFPFSFRFYDDNYTGEAFTGSKCISLYSCYIIRYSYTC